MTESEAVAEYLRYVRAGKLSISDIQARLLGILMDPEIALDVGEIPPSVVFAYVAALWNQPDSAIRGALREWLARQAPMAQKREHAALIVESEQLPAIPPEPATLRKGQWRGVPTFPVGTRPKVSGTIPRPDDPRAMRWIKDTIRDARREARMLLAEKRERELAKRGVHVRKGPGGTVSASTKGKRKRKRIRKRK